MHGTIANRSVARLPRVPVARIVNARPHGVPTSAERGAERAALARLRDDPLRAEQGQRGDGHPLAGRERRAADDERLVVDEREPRL